MASIFGNRLQIFSGNANRELAQRIADFIKVPLGKATVTSFPDGETFVKFDENIRGNDLFIVQPTCPPTNQKLPYPLLADADNKIIQAFGVGGMFGFAKRSAFLFRDGKLVWQDPKGSTQDQAKVVLEYLDSLKTK